MDLNVLLIPKNHLCLILFQISQKFPFQCTKPKNLLENHLSPFLNFKMIIAFFKALFGEKSSVLKEQKKMIIRLERILFVSGKPFGVIKKEFVGAKSHVAQLASPGVLMEMSRIHIYLLPKKRRNLLAAFRFGCPDTIGHVC